MTDFARVVLPVRGRWRTLARTAAVLGTAALSACAPRTRLAPIATPAPAAITMPDRVLVRSAGKVVSVPLEEYVLGTVLAEVTPLGESTEVVARIYEVQAVVARTYAVAQIGRHRAEAFDVCDTAHCQIYDPARIKSSRFSAAAEQAVLRTRGQVLAYGTHAAEAFFHADCGGATASADAVWGGRPIPYLRGGPDDVPEGVHRPWRVATTAEQLRAALNDDPRTAVGRRLDTIEIVARDDSGRAAGLDVQGERSFTVRGDVLRSVINRKMGDRAVQSTRFTLTRTGPRYVFEGSGFGHGVGLCQRGAAARARRGDAVPDILSVYFPGARLTPSPSTQ